ncbi:histidine kinase [Paenibacillus sp. J5C_2022]|uniref:sensor histidine kinase n=1 Tax=Paenibacillus sp. J5C2022 TaxID=2977129 RepID=UPI0021D152D9|nr:histidine kinase [Paenibacillus sp. J5C2022]MCU6710341.1 histidine kinase [Paenibacillus sp. J5C2022]
MSYKWLKWLILWIPTIVIGIWEYVRHAFLLPYISMDLGNLLAPVFVFAVTLTLLRSLFKKLEGMQNALKQQEVMKAAFEEREQLARELHDGISQSLFMLSVKLNKLDRAATPDDAARTMEEIRNTVRHVHEDVRQSIGNLQTPPAAPDTNWLQSLHGVIGEMGLASGIRTEVDWKLQDGMLTAKEKVELLAIIRESLMNIRKHAEAEAVAIKAEAVSDPVEGRPHFHCWIEDNGVGIDEQKLEKKGTYGVKMMLERAHSMGWTLDIASKESGGAIVSIQGGGENS